MNKLKLKVFAKMDSIIIDTPHTEDICMTNLQPSFIKYVLEEEIIKTKFVDGSAKVDKTFINEGGQRIPLNSLESYLFAMEVAKRQDDTLYVIVDSKWLQK